ncbi:MAG: hypothetical protein JW889_14575 [Verrucomicrobia bacterium]|nr:hypothetical protein [Verrucomicrobiota bacterium]
MSRSLAFRVTLLGLSVWVAVGGSRAASPAASADAVPPPLQEFTAQEQAIWNSSIGYFCHAYIWSEQGGYERVPASAYEYVLGAIRWHQRYVTVTGPEEIAKIEKKLADTKARVRLGGTFGLTPNEVRGREMLQEQIAHLERELNEARAKLRQRQLAYNRGDLVALESFGTAVLEKFAAGEIGALERSFRVRFVHDEKTALAEISPKNGEHFWVSLEGWPTGHLVTDRTYSLDKDDRTGVVRGARGYKTAESGMKTALVIERVVVQPYLAGITPAQFVELLQIKGITPKQFVQMVHAASQEKPQAYVGDVLRRLDELPAEDEKQPADGALQ